MKKFLNLKQFDEYIVGLKRNKDKRYVVKEHLDLTGIKTIKHKIFFTKLCIFDTHTEFVYGCQFANRQHFGERSKFFRNSIFGDESFFGKYCKIGGNSFVGNNSTFLGENKFGNVKFGCGVSVGSFSKFNGTVWANSAFRAGLYCDFKKKSFIAYGGKVGKNCTFGDAEFMANAKIGEDCSFYGTLKIGEKSTIGDDCKFYYDVNLNKVSVGKRCLFNSVLKSKFSTFSDNCTFRFDVTLRDSNEIFGFNRPLFRKGVKLAFTQESLVNDNFKLFSIDAFPYASFSGNRLLFAEFWSGDEKNIYMNLSGETINISFVDTLKFNAEQRKAFDASLKLAMFFFEK